MIRTSLQEKASLKQKYFNLYGIELETLALILILIGLKTPKTMESKKIRP